MLEYPSPGFHPVYPVCQNSSRFYINDKHVLGQYVVLWKLFFVAGEEGKKEGGGGKDGQINPQHYPQTADKRLHDRVPP